MLVLRIDDTDPTRTVADGEDAILEDLDWLGVSFDEGPVRQSERGDLYAKAAERALAAGAAERDDEDAVRLRGGGATLLRADGTATYQLASVVDDLELEITHVLRGSDHRPNLELQQRIARALGGELPEVIHHGLVLGPDGKKLSKRHGHASIADLREEGFPAGGGACVSRRARPSRARRPARSPSAPASRDRRDRGDERCRSWRLPREAPIEAVPALRGARSLVEAREYAQVVVAPGDAGASRPTRGRRSNASRELRARGPDHLSADESRSVLRELKAVGGDLRSLRLALTGAAKGPELWAVLGGGAARRGSGARPPGRLAQRDPNAMNGHVVMRCWTARRGVLSRAHIS